MPTKARWSLPIPNTTLPTFLFTSPDKPLSTSPLLLDAARPEPYNLSLSTYRLWSQRLALGLRKAGLKKGEAVMLYSGNSIMFPVVLMGVIMAGGIFTGANPAYNAREVGYQIENSGARFLICAEAALDVGLEGAKVGKLPKDKVFVFDEGYDAFDGKCKGAKGCRPWTDLLAPAKEAASFQWVTGEQYTSDTICLNYSSGTTGLPKGVMITHTNYVSNAVQHAFLATNCRNDYEQVKHKLRWLCLVPMYHAMAQTIFCVGAPSKGIPVYVMRKFDFVKMLEAIQNFRITDLTLVPPIVVAMAKRPETRKYDLSSVENAGSGAAPLGREIAIEFEKLWPDGQVNLKQVSLCWVFKVLPNAIKMLMYGTVKGYGMTE